MHASESIERTPDTSRTFVEHVCIDHRGADIAMAEDFLDSADIVAIFEKMCGKGVTEGVAAGMLRYAGHQHRFMNGTLEHRSVDMEPSFLAGVGGMPAMLLWEDPLPGPLLCRIWVFLGQGTRQV